MRAHGVLGLVGNLIVALIMSLSAGCIITESQYEINALADRLIFDYCDDCALIMIDEARYVKSTVGNSNVVLLVVDGIVECGISESVTEKLTGGTPVRYVNLVDDEDLTRKLLAKMNTSNSIVIELNYSYAFFSSVPSPDECKRVLIEGCVYPLMACWQACEFYDPNIPMDELSIVREYRKMANMQDGSPRRSSGR